MPTIKNVTEKKEKKKLKSLIRFIVSIKLTTTAEGKEKSPKNLQNKSKHKNNKCFS